MSVAWATASRTRGSARRSARSTSTRVRRSIRFMRRRASPRALSACTFSVLRCSWSFFICLSRSAIASLSSSAPRSETERADLVPEALDVAELDVFVAADHIGELRQLDRPRVRLGRKSDQRLLDEPAVLAGKLPLDAPHLGEPERVERGAAQ